MRIIRLKEVMQCTGLSRSTIYKFIEEGMIPRSVSLGGRAVGWVEQEILAWVLKRVEERDIDVRARDRAARLVPAVSSAGKPRPAATIPSLPGGFPIAAGWGGTVYTYHYSVNSVSVEGARK